MMEEYPYLEQLQKEIKNIDSDIKVESVLAIAMENGLDQHDFIIALESLFSRSYSQDILFSTIEEDANRKEFLQLHISRNGWHDLLPEGVFYQSEKEKYRDSNAALMAADHVKNKQKEREIRRFFMPFENAVFRQQIALEIEEAHLLKGLNSGILNEYFIDFWRIPLSIPSSLITPLIGLLPHANKVAGDPDLMSQSLEKILGEHVSASIMKTSATKVDRLYLYPLGDATLGIDLVMGEQFKEDAFRLEFTIGPLRNSQVKDYLEGGNKEEFLKTFYGFFVPAEVEVSTKIEVSQETCHMSLYEDDEPVLGFSSVLQA